MNFGKSGVFSPEKPLFTGDFTGKTGYTIISRLLKYRIEISERAIEQLRALPRELRRNIGYRLELLSEDLTGDVKKLKAQQHHYRLRVGGHRVLFRLAGDTIEVYAVRDRKDAYE